jgi:hypothetical protein
MQNAPMPTFLTPQEGFILLEHPRGGLTAIPLHSNTCGSTLIIKPGLVTPMAASTTGAGAATPHSSTISSSIQGFMQRMNSASGIGGFTGSSTAFKV